MSKAVEAAAKAVLANFHAPDDLHPAWHLNPETVATAALSAALPHLTEGLAEVIAAADMDWHFQWEKCRSETAGDPGPKAEFVAAAITEELKRRIAE